MPARLPRRWYMLLVSSLTVFVFGIILARQPIEAYLARATIRVSGDRLDLQEIQDAITQRDNLVHALRRSDLLAPAGDLSPHDRQYVERMRDVLQLDVVKTADDDGCIIQITWRGPDPDRSLQLVHQLARQYVAGWASGSARGSTIDARLQAELSEARQDEREQRRALDAFFRQHFVDAVKTSDSIQDQEPQGAGDLGTQGGAANGEVAAPPHEGEWQLWAKRLSQLQSTLQTLLRDRTAEHPQVRKLELDIAELERRLAQTPHYRQAMELLRSATLTQSDASNGDLKKDDRSGRARPELETPVSPLEQFEALHAQYGSTLQRREQVERRLWQQAGPKKKVVAWIAESGRIIGRIGGNLPLSRLTAVAVMAIAAGGGLFHLASRMERATVFTSVVQVRHHLAVPVIGLCADGNHGGPAPAGEMAVRLVRFSTRGCELALVAVAILLLLLVLTSPTTSLSAVDPFGAFSEALFRVIGL